MFFFYIEAKRTRSIVLKLISKRSEKMFLLKNLNINAKWSKLMLNCESSEAKRKCSIVEKIISKQSEHVYIEEFKYRSEAYTFVSLKIYFEANTFIQNSFWRIKAKKFPLSGIIWPSSPWGQVDKRYGHHPIHPLSWSTREWGCHRKRGGGFLGLNTKRMHICLFSYLFSYWWSFEHIFSICYWIDENLSQVTEFQRKYLFKSAFLILFSLQFWWHSTR
jgi:hypothetical protein